MLIVPPKIQVLSSLPPSGGVLGRIPGRLVGVGGALGSGGGGVPGGTGVPGGCGTAWFGAAEVSWMVTSAAMLPENRLSGLRASGSTWMLVTVMLYCSVGRKVNTSAVGSRLEP